jgi:hypothetical protein
LRCKASASCSTMDQCCSTILAKGRLLKASKSSGLPK